MKKLALLSLILLSLNASAQLKYIGLTGGATFAKQKWQIKAIDEKQKMKNLFGFNGSLYTEWGLHDVFSWVIEAQYNQKGGKINPDAPLTPQQNIRSTFFSINNYAKLRSEGIDGAPYVLFGPKAEYLFSHNGPVAYNKLSISAGVGAGYELYIFDPWVPFFEVIFNPPITNAYNDAAFKVKNKAVEIRIGIKYKRKSISRFDDCPPVFTSN